MAFSFYDWCGGCHKKRWFVKNRVYQLKVPRIPVTSNNKLCGRCFSKIKKMVK